LEFALTGDGAARVTACTVARTFATPGWQ